MIDPSGGDQYEVLQLLGNHSRAMSPRGGFLGRVPGEDAERRDRGMTLGTSRGGIGKNPICRFWGNTGPGIRGGHFVLRSGFVFPGPCISGSAVLRGPIRCLDQQFGVSIQPFRVGSDGSTGRDSSRLPRNAVFGPRFFMRRFIPHGTVGKVATKGEGRVSCELSHSLHQSSDYVPGKVP